MQSSLSATICPVSTDCRNMFFSSKNLLKLEELLDPQDVGKPVRLHLCLQTACCTNNCKHLLVPLARHAHSRLLCSWSRDEHCVGDGYCNGDKLCFLEGL